MTPRHNPTAPNRNEAMRSASEIATKRKSKAARDRLAMKDLAAAELAAQDALVLERLQTHLSEDHGPLGHHPSIQGVAWTNLPMLERAHLKLHEVWKGHTH